MKWRVLTGFLLLLASLLDLGIAQADTQHFQFDAPEQAAAPHTVVVMKDLAERMLPVYHDENRLQFLENLSALQVVAGDYNAAFGTRQSLRKLRRERKLPATTGRDVLLDVYAGARETAIREKRPFSPLFRERLGVAVGKLGDLDAYRLTHWEGTPPEGYAQAFQAALDALHGQRVISMPQALHLVRIYLSCVVYAQTHGVVAAVGEADTARRYLVDDDVRIKTAYGVVLHARIVRPRTGKPGPALLEFTIDRSPGAASACAAHGYVGVVAYARGPSRPDGWVTPFEHDGRDARAVIDWIARQPWSDGRVGMYGDGYSGFTAWAATLHMPKALKAIATTDAMAPGIDFPTLGRIYGNAAYRWAVDHTRGVSRGHREDEAFWERLNETWYESGRPYRDLDRIAKMPNPIFRRWLNHPSYDPYWQRMIPVGREFAKILIPTLTVTGYYAANAAGDLYYYREHARYRPGGRDTLLIGPYDDRSLRDNPTVSLHGEPVDPVARVDLSALRFEWFDHVLRGSPLPPLLSSPVNYEVMGANVWRHRTSLAAVAGGSLKLYLKAGTPAAPHRLTTIVPDRDRAVTQTVDFKRREDAAWRAPASLVRHDLDLHHEVAYIGDPLLHPVTIAGRYAGRLSFRVNKLDMDISIALYARKPDGDYLLLSHSIRQRASYARNIVHRHLLKAGERQTLSFTSRWMTATRLAAGTRLVLVLGINKRPDQELNYGSGRNVAAESIADAGRPLEVRWYGDSYVDIPLERAPEPPSVGNK